MINMIRADMIYVMTSNCSDDHSIPVGWSVYSSVKIQRGPLPTTCLQHRIGALEWTLEILMIYQGNKAQTSYSPLVIYLAHHTNHDEITWNITKCDLKKMLNNTKYIKAMWNKSQPAWLSHSFEKVTCIPCIPGNVFTNIDNLILRLFYCGVYAYSTVSWHTPTNTQRNKHVSITWKWCFGVMIMCLLRCVSGTFLLCVARGFVL